MSLMMVILENRENRINQGSLKILKKRKTTKR
jgi:hypothetical protein